MKNLKDLFNKAVEFDEKEKIDFTRLPVHIAIIMDGNGRWARKRGLPRTAGHTAGVETLREIIRTCSDIGIKYLTLYAFSTENWKRPQDEVSALMQLLILYLRKEIHELHNNNVQIRTIGDITKLPENTLNEIEEAVLLTKNNDGLTVNIALNYGGRAEIIKAVKNICQEVVSGKMTIDDIDEKDFSKNLYTGDIPDPDLIIRPSGELRVSNFLLWQSAYSEFWFSNIFWPDFKRQHLLQAIADYQNRDRRFGGVK